MTTPAASLLAAILDDPDNDDLRLIYADCLEEAGNIARAEFIRVQIAIERPSETVYADMLENEEQLLSGHAHKWLPMLEGAAVDWGSFVVHSNGLVIVPKGWTNWAFRFRKGFIEQLNLPAEAFFAHAPAILAEHPVRQVNLTTWPIIEAFRDAQNRSSIFHLHGFQHGLWYGAYAEWITGSLTSRTALCRNLLRHEWPRIDFSLPPAILNPDNIWVSAELLENAIAH